jgi:hypothetical protein
MVAALQSVAASNSKTEDSRTRVPARVLQDEHQIVDVQMKGPK